EAENAIVTAGDEYLHEALGFARRLCPEHTAYRQLRHADIETLALRLGLAQSHVGKRGVGEHAIRDESIARAALAPGQIVRWYPDVAARHVSDWRAPATFANGPAAGWARLQPLVDTNDPTRVQLDPRLVEADIGCVRDAPSRNQDVAALDSLLSRARAD